MRLLGLSCLVLSSVAGQLLPPLSRSETTDSYIEYYSELAVDCAGDSDMAGILDIVLPKCLPNAKDIPDLNDACPSVDDIKNYTGEVGSYLDCISSGLGWSDNAKAIAATLAGLPAAVAADMDVTNQNSKVSQCVPTSEASASDWIESCGYSKDDVSAINALVDKYLEKACIPFTYLQVCSAA